MCWQFIVHLCPAEIFVYKKLFSLHYSALVDICVNYCNLFAELFKIALARDPEIEEKQIRLRFLWVITRPWLAQLNARYFE